MSPLRRRLAWPAGLLLLAVCITGTAYIFRLELAGRFLTKRLPHLAKYSGLTKAEFCRSGIVLDLASFKSRGVELEGVSLIFPWLAVVFEDGNYRAEAVALTLTSDAASKESQSISERIFEVLFEEQAWDRDTTDKSLSLLVDQLNYGKIRLGPTHISIDDQRLTEEDRELNLTVTGSDLTLSAELLANNKRKAIDLNFTFHVTTLEALKSAVKATPPIAFMDRLGIQIAEVDPVHAASDSNVLRSMPFLTGSGYYRADNAETRDPGMGMDSQYTLLIDLQPFEGVVRSQTFQFLESSIGFAGNDKERRFRSYGRGAIEWTAAGDDKSEAEGDPSGAWKFERDQSDATLLFAPNADNRIEFSTTTFHGLWPDAFSSRYELEDNSTLLPILEVLSPLDER